MIYELSCRYDSRQSFYKKAFIRETETKKVLHRELISYNTIVANYVYYKEQNKKVFEYFGKYSQTTTRHQKEFFKQLGLAESELKELLKNGKIEKYL